MDSQFWNKSWNKHLNNYQDDIPRTGYFIKWLLPKVKTVLEVACGSSRDSIYLAQKGCKATASDYAQELIDKLKEEVKLENLTYQQVDAFNMPFEDNSFELVFHNGLFIYYNLEDNLKLLKEQLRVSSKFVLIVVHNEANKKLVEQFGRLAKDDALYDIRFFNQDNISKLLEGVSGSQYTNYKFGGMVDSFYHRKLKGIFNPVSWFAPGFIPKYYQGQSWTETERIACLITKK